MITQRSTVRSTLVMGLLSLPFVTGCNQKDIQEPGGGVGGNATVPDRSGGVTPSPSTPGPGDMRNSTGTTESSTGADSTTRTGTTSDMRRGTGTSSGTGTSASERNGSAASPSSGTEAGNAGTISGSGTGNNSSGGTTSKGLGPQ